MDDIASPHSKNGTKKHDGVISTSLFGMTVDYSECHLDFVRIGCGLLRSLPIYPEREEKFITVGNIAVFMKECIEFLHIQPDVVKAACFHCLGAAKDVLLYHISAGILQRIDSFTLEPG